MAKARRRRRRLSMTSLIDVIFLLLLFFMLTSTFSKFAEVELASAGAGGTTAPDKPPLFLQLASDTISVNGEGVTLENITESALSQAEAGTSVLVSLRDGVDAQRLTDLLVALRALPDLTITVLGS